MSDLAQSFFRCVQALSRLGRGPLASESADQPADDATLDAISEAAAAELDPFLQRVYRVGDRLQSGAIDSLEIFLDRRSDPDASLVTTWEAVDRTRPEDF